MKIRFLFILILLILLPVTTIFAQENIEGNEALTNEGISQRCRATQGYLKNTLKPRDLRARVDRLQAYRYIYQRLDVFAERLERNNQPMASEFRVHLDTFNKQIDTFKNDYEAYDVTRELATNFRDCQKNPAEFHKNINALRSTRQKVQTDVAEIHTLLDQAIKSQLEALNLKLIETGSTGDSNG